jgi:hypothetical protein
VIGEYIIFLDKVLGKGAFSLVYKAIKKDDKKKEEGKKQEFAIKEIPNEILLNKLGDKGRESLEKEVKIC